MLETTCFVNIDTPYMFFYPSDSEEMEIDKPMKPYIERRMISVSEE